MGMRYEKGFKANRSSSSVMEVLLVVVDKFLNTCLAANQQRPMLRATASEGQS